MESAKAISLFNIETQMTDKVEMRTCDIFYDKTCMCILYNSSHSLIDLKEDLKPELEMAPKPCS